MKPRLLINHTLKKELGHTKPVVSIETAILTHGMSVEYSGQFIKSAFRVCNKSGVSPAFLSVLNGDLCVGMTEKNLLTLLQKDGLKKISLRNIGVAMAQKWSGGTTVSAGVQIAKQADIPVFCTGGIGGVHRGFNKSFDISQDLLALSKTPVVVVTAGAKAVLDLPKTFESLEFFGIPVIGFQTKEFPSFWSRESGIPLETTVSSPEEIVSIWKYHIKSGGKSALIVANPVPVKDQIPCSEINGLIDSALDEARFSSVSGPELTPFLLQSLDKKTGGRCLKTNLSLAINNVELGAAISKVI